jgi:hypothetical protein
MDPPIDLMSLFGIGVHRCAVAGITLTRSSPTTNEISLARIVTSLIDELYSTISHRRRGISKHRARVKLYRKQKGDADGHPDANQF